jgi:hypothetical protein
MARLLIEIDDVLLAWVMCEAQAREVSLDVFINDAISTIQTKSNLPANKSVSANDILSRLIERTTEIAAGEKFTLIDICEVEDWESISGGERKGLGRNFRKAVEGVIPQIARLVDKTSSNKAIYERV